MKRWPTSAVVESAARERVGGGKGRWDGAFPLRQRACQLVSGKGCLQVSDVSLLNLLSCWDLGDGTRQAWDTPGMGG